jgi:PhzF family phenazine biosynthesis protein
MELPLFKVNAFTTAWQGGNPAGVCPLQAWLPDELMQAIARENGYSETAFFVGNGDSFDLRWFTPGCEVDLCGHATLASAFVLHHVLGGGSRVYRFNTRSGVIPVEAAGDLLTLDMPALGWEPVELPQALANGLEVTPQAVFAGQDYMVVLPSADMVARLKPSFSWLGQADRRGTIVTAPGDGEVDFVSRWFGGRGVGVDEDPVTGSAHCMLVPYWAGVLGKKVLKARQVSARGGELYCELAGPRVRVGGHAVLYFKGTITV